MVGVVCQVNALEMRPCVIRAGLVEGDVAGTGVVAGESGRSGRGATRRSEGRLGTLRDVAMVVMLRRSVEPGVSVVLRVVAAVW